MKWNKFRLKTTTEAEDIVSSMLADLGIEGVEIEDKIPLTESDKEQMFVDILPEIEPDDGVAYLSFYLEEEADTEAVLANVKKELEEMSAYVNVGECTIEESETEDVDWVNNWKKYFKPIEVGKKILIQPEWCPYDKSTDRIVFTVNPGMTFGTGTHASTKLCICELEKVVNTNTVLLDAGCGSGILSVIALMLGAKKAVAVDIDENCIHTAYENADRNKTDKSKYSVYAGDIVTDLSLFEKISDTKYDVIVANIVADVIISLLPTIKKLINKNGTFICSGIIKERLEDVKNAMKKENITPCTVSEEDGWAAVTCKF